jgi:hypothetical protein
MTEEEKAKVAQAIQKLARDVYEIVITLGVLLNILEIEGVCTKEAFFAARAAASPVADQILEGLKEKKKEEDK